ncbi:MAG: lytic transglycosylase domain-containing protein [Clostridia bacterium]
MATKRKKKKKSIAILVISILVLTAIIFFGYKTFNNVMYPVKFDDVIKKYSKQYDLPLSLCYALIKAESNFDEKAVSRANAKGLTQITDTTFEWITTSFKEFSDLKESDIFDVDTNIRVGFFYLEKCLQKYSDERLALCAYNAGPGTLDTWLKDSRFSKDGELLVIPAKETKNYVEKIAKAKEQYKKIYKID